MLTIELLAKLLALGQAQVTSVVCGFLQMGPDTPLFRRLLHVGAVSSGKAEAAQTARGTCATDSRFREGGMDSN
jgi:hypothetical protein